MANTLTNLIPTIYQSLDRVSREMVGFVPSVTRNTGAERAALGQQILVPITTAIAAIDNTPAVTPPDAGDGTVDNAAVSITKSKSVPIRWNGEQQLGMRNAGTYNNVLADQFTQAFRTLVNLVEADVWAAAYQTSSRAYGTAGTAPFGTDSDFSDTANLKKILEDNGAPDDGDYHLVLGSAAVLNLRKQKLLVRSNEAGSPDFRHTGSIAVEPLHGFMLHNSAAVAPITKGTGASYVTSGSTAVGGTSIALITGTGTVNAGDVVTFAADSSNKYVVNTGVAAPGTIVLGKPGARVTIPTSNALTVGGNYTPNVGFHRSAVQLVARPPATPLGPDGRPMDLAEDAILVTDEYSGLTFEVSVYRQFKQLAYYVGLAWGVSVTKPEFVGTLIG